MYATVDLSKWTFVTGSPTDHSPVLNLSKSGGGSAGSLGDGEHSGSEADGPDVPPSPRSPRSAAEDDEDDNISEPDDEDDKDQGNLILQCFVWRYNNFCV